MLRFPRFSATLLCFLGSVTVLAQRPAGSISTSPQNAEQRPELIVQSGHLSVESVAFSSDGKLIASAGGGAIKLWDVSTGTELRTFRGHDYDVFSVVISPDGKTLASGSRDATVKLWDIATGLELRTFEGHENTVRSVAFSPDGKIVASGSFDKQVKLWGITSGKELQTLNGHTETVHAVAFSPDGKTLASGSADETIKLWEVATGKLLQTLQALTTVRTLTFSNDGRMLGVGTVFTTEVRFLDSGQKGIFSASGETEGSYSVAFATDKRIMASAGYKTLALWDTQTGKQIRTLKVDAGSPRSVVFSPDGRTLASGGPDGGIRLWDVPSGQQLRSLSGHAQMPGLVSCSSFPD